MAPQPQLESAVLAPRDPSIDTNSDEWPEFELRHVRVRAVGETNKDSLTSLLLASEHYPLSVTGYLQPLPKSLSHLHLQSSPARTILIELPEVRTIAYGQYSNGTVALWAAGKAGWYKINPSQAYSLVYQTMLNAVDTFYFIADAYREPRVQGRGKNATPLPEYTAIEVIDKWAQKYMGDLADTAAAAGMIYKHRDFLMASMMVGKENIAWGKNSFYIHLRKKFPEDYKTIAKRLAGPPKLATQSARMRQASVDTTSSTTSSLKRKRGRPAKNRDVDVISIDSSSVASVPVKDASKQAGSANLSSHVPTRPTSKRRTRQTSSAPPSETVPEAPAEVEPTPTPVREDSEDDEQEEVSFARKGMSALRPRAHEASKSASRNGKAPALEDDDGEEEEEEAEPSSSPTGSKRRLEENMEPRQSKKRTRKQEVDEAIDMPESPSAASNDPPTPDATSGALDEHSSDLAVRLKHTPDPVQEDTWICALDGCTHKVYVASESDSQRLIREHYALHAYDDDQRVQMVKKLQAPSLPVNHLMEKVRLQAKLEGFPGSRVAGTRFPQAVSRRY